LLFEQIKFLRAPFADWDDHSAALFQLFDQWTRHMVERARHDDAVERRVLGPALVTVAGFDVNIPAMLALQRRFRLSREAWVDLDCVNSGNKFCQNRGLIPRTRADLEDAIAWLRSQQLGH